MRKKASVVLAAVGVAAAAALFGGVLGGNRAAFKILGRYPWSWEVYPFGSVPPAPV